MLTASACSPVPESVRRAPEPQRIVVISIDTCRADHLSLYGYERQTTPRLERLAEEAVVFDNAFAQATDTTPSHASLMTSLYPFRHGAANGVPLGDEYTTLAEILAQAGYRTAAFVSGWTMTARDSGLAQGFELYDDRLSSAGMPGFSQKPTERSAEATTDRALEWLAEHANERFFLFVHYFDPHGQYAPPPPYDTMFPPKDSGQMILDPEDIPDYATIEGETDAAVYISRYDGEIRYVDDQIGRILGELEARGLGDDALLIVSSDHGEGLTENENYFSHGTDLYDPSTRIPLLIASPGLPEGLRVRQIVESIDVLPTVLELAGLEPAQTVDGISLLPLIDGASRSPRAFALSMTTKELTLRQAGYESDVSDDVALRTADWKYVRSPDQGSRLFDVGRDPSEIHDLSAYEPSRRDAMGALVTRLLGPAGLTPESETSLDDAERARLEEGLRALGYLD